MPEIVQQTAPLIAIAESLLKFLEKGGVTNLPVLDIVVECVRTCLLKGMDEFKDLAWKTFKGRIPMRRAKALYRRFLKENRERFGDFILSGQVEP